MANQRREIAEKLYDIEVEISPQGFKTYELVTKQGGSVRDDKVDGRNKSADVGFNNKDINFITVLDDIGMLDRLEKVLAEND